LGGGLILRNKEGTNKGHWGLEKSFKHKGHEGTYKVKGEGWVQHGKDSWLKRNTAKCEPGRVWDVF
jgi:hypothetical protein